MMLFKRYIAFFIFLFSTNSTAYSQELNPTYKTGAYTITSTLLEILGQNDAETYKDMIDSNKEITWEIYVSEKYDPSKPPGIMVYVSPQNQIKTPSGWMDVMEDANLIWVAAQMSGNDILSQKRIMMAVLALPLIQDRYSVDTSRLYISGFSGGGRIASIVTANFPQLFSGAVYNCGVNFWGDISSAELDLIKKKRFVFITGTDDFNLQDTKSVYYKYKAADVKNIKLMVINRMGHENPKRNKFAQAINFLDGS